METTENSILQNILATARAKATKATTNKVVVLLLSLLLLSMKEIKTEHWFLEDAHTKQQPMMSLNSLKVSERLNLKMYSLSNTQEERDQDHALLSLKTIRLLKKPSHLFNKKKLEEDISNYLMIKMNS